MMSIVIWCLPWQHSQLMLLLQTSSRHLPSTSIIGCALKALVSRVKRHLRLPVLLAGFPNASQEDAKIEKTAKSAQKGLEKAAQNVTPDTSDLSNPFDGAGGIADKVRPLTHLLGYRSG